MPTIRIAITLQKSVILQIKSTFSTAATKYSNQIPKMSYMLYTCAFSIHVGFPLVRLERGFSALHTNFFSY
jgi:hypothetical protein